MLLTFTDTSVAVVTGASRPENHEEEDVPTPSEPGEAVKDGPAMMH